MRDNYNQKWVILACAGALALATVVFALLASIDVHLANDGSIRGGSSPNILQSRSSAPTHPNPSRHSSQLLLPLHKHALALLLTAILVIGVLIAFMVCFWDNLRTCLVWRQLSSRPEGGSPEERLTLVADEHQGTVDEGVPVNEIATRRETDLDEPFRNMVMDIKGIIAPTSAPIAIASRSAPVGPCKFVRTSTPSEFASTSAPKC